MSGLGLTTICTRIARGKTDGDLIAPPMDRREQMKKWHEGRAALNAAKRKAREEKEQRETMEKLERQRRGLGQEDFYLPMGFRPGVD